MQRRSEELLIHLEQQFKQKQYHLLLANLKICVAVLGYEGIILCEADSKAFQSYLRALDEVVREYHFRNEMSIGLVQALEKILLRKGQKEVAASWSDLKKNDLCDHQQDDILWRPLQYQDQYQFKSFFDDTREDPYYLLKAQQALRLKHWHNNREKHHETVLMDLVLGYWRTLKAHAPQLPEASSRENILQLGDEMLRHIQQDSKNVAASSLCPYLLMWLQLFQEQPFTVDRNTSSWATSEFRIAFILQGLAQRFTAQLSEGDVIKELTKVITLNQSLGSLAPLKASQGLFYDYTPQLAKTRTVFTGFPKVMDPSSIFSAQKKHTQDLLDLLNTLISRAIQALGEPPCELALCVLGSTSRSDRRPYSDVECLLLYRPRGEGNPDQARCVTYVYHVFYLFELLLVRLGETPNPEHCQANAGVHLDSSSHVLHKGVWGTPEDIVKRFLEAAASTPSDAHPWASDESFYALLHPLLVQHDKPASRQLFKEYQSLLQTFLKQDVQLTDRPNVLERVTGFSLVGLKRHQAIAWACVKHVVDKCRDEQWMSPLKPGDRINLKDQYYKPLAYLALNLRLFYQLDTLHPADSIVRISSTYAWGGKLIEMVLTTALAWITQLQIQLHLKKGYQEEELLYPSSLSSKEKKRWAGLDLLTRGLLKPLYQLLHHDIQDSSLPDFQNLLYPLLQRYCIARQPWMEYWQIPGDETSTVMEASSYSKIGKNSLAKWLVTLLPAGDG